MEAIVQHARPSAPLGRASWPLRRPIGICRPQYRHSAARSAVRCRAAMEVKDAQKAMVAGLLATCLVRFRGLFRKVAYMLLMIPTASSHPSLKAATKSWQLLGNRHGPHTVMYGIADMQPTHGRCCDQRQWRAVAEVQGGAGAADQVPHGAWGACPARTQVVPYSKRPIHLPMV